MASRGPVSVHQAWPTRRVLAVVAVAGALISASACSSVQANPDRGTDVSPVAAPKTPPVELSANVADGADDVAVNKRVKANATDGTITRVSMYYEDAAGKKTKVPGTIGEAGTRWSADGLLEPAQTYRIKMTGKNADGARNKTTTVFQTQALTLDEQTYASIQPLNHETVGVGMPVIIRFDIPVTRRAAVEKKLSISTTPKHIKGSWHWLSDSEVHYRPKKYWPEGTKVTVHVDINGMRTAEGIYGQKDRAAQFTVGTSVISTVDMAKHQMTVRVDGKVARTMRETSGKPGFETRAGIKLVMAKSSHKRMDASTIGISKDSPEYYNLADVRYAMRVTNSGEFVHAAPWSVGSQGYANVSHGCVGLSTANARWLFGISHRGDVVKFINSDRSLEPGNGWTDWNQSYAQYKKGSALN